MRLAWIFLALVVISAIAYQYISFQKEYNANPILRQTYDNHDYLGAWNSMVLVDPAISKRLFIGNETAPLTLVIAVDFESEESRQAYEAHALWLKQNYVDTGKARLYHKYYITKQDYDSQNLRYRKVRAALCHFGDADPIAEHLKLFTAEYPFECNEPDFLYRDVLETEEFLIQTPSIIVGIDGNDNTVIYGNPTQDYISRRIRAKEIKVGI